MNYKEIISSITNKDLQPVYFLMGEEPYYIDKLANAFSKNVLSAEEQEFNQVILYGKEIVLPPQLLVLFQSPFRKVLLD